MKNSLRLKLLALIVLSIFSMTTIHAQIKFGGRVGLNISKQEFKQDSLTVEPKSKFGLDLALVSEFPLGELVSISPELHWLQKGYKIEDIGGPIENLTATLNYLELPILVKFNFGETTKFFVMGGPSVGYFLSGTTKDEDGNKDNIDLEEYHRVDVGAHLGAGFGIGPIIVDVRYILGFTNLARDIPNTEIHNTSFGAGVSIMF